MEEDAVAGQSRIRSSLILSSALPIDVHLSGHRRSIALRSPRFAQALGVHPARLFDAGVSPLEAAGKPSGFARPETSTCNRARVRGIEQGIRSSPEATLVFNGDGSHLAVNLMLGPPGGTKVQLSG